MNVIFVCTGNTCRSPIAEGYLKSLNIPSLNVSSRGLFADGSPVSINSSTVMGELGIDISSHISSQFTKDDIESDLIICLSHSHYDALIGCGIKKEKLLILGDGISDPFGGDIHIYRLCRDEIINAVDRLVYSGTFTDFNIVSVEYRHLGAIADLEKECFCEPWSENAIAESLSAGTSFFVAEQNQKVIGYIGISTVLDEGYITNVAVSGSMRQKGVATLLLCRVFSLARERALSFVSLEVRASNSPAISLYSKLGFERVGERKDFYRDPRENAIIMTRRFEQLYEDSCN